MKKVFKLQSARIVNNDGSRIDPTDYVWEDIGCTFDLEWVAKLERIGRMKAQEGAGVNFKYIRVVTVCE